MIISGPSDMRRLPIILAITILLTGCRGGGDTLGTIAEWVDALHAADFARLAAVDGAAPAADEEDPRFLAWRSEVAGVLESYEAQRDLGEIEIDPRGYMVPLATRMGRGTYWELVGATSAGASIQVPRVATSRS